MTRRPGGSISPLDRWRWAAWVPVDRAVDRALLLVLAESADRDTLTATRTLRTLARQTSTNERSVLKSLARLEARGLVTIERRGRNRATRYVLAATVEVTDGEPLLPTRQHVAATVTVVPGLFQEGDELMDWRESLDINGENARREADGGWAVGPFRFP